MDVILGDSDRAKLKEVIERMLAGEKSLHSKTIGPVKVFRKTSLPKLLAEQLKRDLQRGILKVAKNGKEILICEKRTL